MEIESIINTVVGTYGFPIAACYALYVMCTRTLKSQTDAINHLAEVVDTLRNLVQQEIDRND